MNQPFSIGQCPLCPQGLLIVVKDKADNKPLIFCDDCDARWANPADALAVQKFPPTMQSKPVTIANWDEISAWGWQYFVENKNA